MRIAVLSNITMSPLTGFIKKNGFTQIYEAGYGQYITELIDSKSELNKRQYEIAFIHLDTEEFLKGVFNQMPVDLNNEEFDKFYAALQQCARDNPKTMFIVSNHNICPYNFNTYLEGNCRQSFNNIVASFNERLTDLCGQVNNIKIFNFARLMLLYGHQAAVDYKFWYLGRIKYTNILFKALAKDLTCMIGTLCGKSKKVLVLDADNTLWGGVIGEDGIQGILLGEDGIAKAYRDFQRVILSLKQLGILLVLCSKNNEKDVCDVLNDHPMSLLRVQDFIIKKINWENKAENIQAVAQELNLGLDSFVFIDDNPVERELVRSALSGVAVPDFPSDVWELVPWFNMQVVYPYFSKVTLTQEDGAKQQQYQRNVIRKQAQQALNVDDYIKSLDIKIIVSLNNRDHLVRFAQLTQKTNQFNLTTRRYNEADINSFLVSDDNLIFGLEYSDKFGSEGIIGMVILKVRGDKAVFDTFLMSCRVIGRGVEYRFIKELASHPALANIKLFEAEYIPTAKNGLVKDFYSACGFAKNEAGYFCADREAILNMNQGGVL